MLGVYGEEGLFLACPVGQNTGLREWVELLERRSIKRVKVFWGLIGVPLFREIAMSTTAEPTT